MGAIAKAVLDHGGKATGIIPEFMTTRERPRRSAQELIVTRDMHERKRTMFERADAFVALPGGIGTLEEVVEQLTWAQLGRHRKPILFANIKGYWDPLLALFAHMRELEFMPGALRVDFLVAERVEDILPMLRDASRAVAEAAETMAMPPSGCDSSFRGAGFSPRAGIHNHHPGLWIGLATSACALRAHLRAPRFGDSNPPKLATRA